MTALTIEPIFSADTTQMDTPTLLSLIGSLSRNRYIVQFLDRDDRALGELQLKGGQVLNAECGTLTGHDAFSALLDGPVQLLEAFHAQGGTLPTAPLGSLERLLMTHVVERENSDLALQALDEAPMVSRPDVAFDTGIAKEFSSTPGQIRIGTPETGPDALLRDIQRQDRSVESDTTTSASDIEGPLQGCPFTGHVSPPTPTSSENVLIDSTQKTVDNGEPMKGPLPITPAPKPVTVPRSLLLMGLAAMTLLLAQVLKRR